MTDAQFNGFLAGGLSLLIAAAMLIAWQLWRLRDDERDNAQSALHGVGHELRINLQRMVNELALVAAVPDAGPDQLLPIHHPQLNGVNSTMIRANRNALAIIGATYQEMESRKVALRAAMKHKMDRQVFVDDAMNAVIDGIATLYMWEEHEGARPAEAGKVRSWHVRDWMKAHGFAANAFPGMHLRDEVVDRLRRYGLRLTPRPLTHTAHEYYSMQYDRYADPNAPFWKRRKKRDDDDDEDHVDPILATAGALAVTEDDLDVADGSDYGAAEALETTEEVARPLSDGGEVEVR